MQKTAQAILLSSIMMFLFSAPVLADMDHMQKGHHTGHHRGDMNYGKKSHEVSCWTETLTDDQKAKFAKMRLELKKAKSLLKAQIKVKKIELVTLVTEDNPDQSAIDQKINEILALKKQKMQKKYAFKIAIRSMLTPEQRVQFDMSLLKKAVHGKGQGYQKKSGHKNYGHR
ncbi:MAG: periplasmic heavy metal sensor [Nitrospirales bacterium]|nr:periplasmic heavy metal sensor [Nitrospira sp.]MDR4501153.1 periplasmic heavy metal sensor [Nitrospirales bacterium]